MKLFLDSANLQDVEDSLSRGYIAGITTNPSLLSKEPKANFYVHLRKIVEAIKAAARLVPLSVEVFTSDVSKMVGQAEDIYKKLAYDKLNIKVPIGWNELKII